MLAPKEYREEADESMPAGLEELSTIPHFLKGRSTCAVPLKPG
jgi:hypothetical protein